MGVTLLYAAVCLHMHVHSLQGCPPLQFKLQVLKNVAKEQNAAREVHQQQLATHTALWVETKRLQRLEAKQ